MVLVLQNAKLPLKPWNVGLAGCGEELSLILRLLGESPMARRSLGSSRAIVELHLAVSLCC